MARRFTEKDSNKCWDQLVKVLSYGDTISFWYKKTPQQYLLIEGWGSGRGYRDVSSAEYLLDDIRFALFDENLPKIQLMLSGIEDGPITDSWTFTFTKAGLVESYYYYNDD